MSSNTVLCILMELTIAIASGLDGTDRYFSGEVGWAIVYWIISALAVGVAAFIYVYERRDGTSPQGLLPK